MPLEDRERHRFKDEAAVERYLVKALCTQDWTWVSWVREDAQGAYPTRVAQLDRKFGLTDDSIAFMRSVDERPVS